MEIVLITVFVLYVIAVVAYFAKRTNKVFVIKIHHQTVKVTKGQPPHSFVRECEEIAKIRKNIKGKLYGVREHGTLTLSFSSSIKDSERQMFRNVWPIAVLGSPQPPHSGTPKRAKLP